jgi:alginate O-acetyltransferase complex protein AlgI
VLFTEPSFLFLFLPILLALYFLKRPHGEYANVLLLAASVLFYARGGGVFTWLMLASIAFNYWMAIAVSAGLKGPPGQPARSKAWLTAAIAVNLAVLGLFKYANFFADNLNALLAALRVQPFGVPEVLLPIGISFYTFHAISYVVDVYRGDATAQKSPVHAALYLLLFPQLIAGPIIRYREIAGQLARRVVGVDDFAAGVRRFIVGLGKKVLIANNVATAADGIFALGPAELTPALAWVGIVCYTLQIYFDFSGYSDMAIGLGRMFGFRFPENFRWPYAAGSVQEFWRRWHISLSAWFRDYLYVPLGGNRVAPRRMYLNLVLVFFLCGLWHGASWSFVVWGLYHGSFLVAERLGLATHVRRLPAALQHAYLLIVVMVGWVFFRADTLAHAAAYLGAMAGVQPPGITPFAVAWFLTPEVLLALVAGAIGAAPIVPALDRAVSRVAPGQVEGPALSDVEGPALSEVEGPALSDVEGPRRWLAAAAATAALALVLVASILQIAGRSYDPFIYFRF